MHLPEMPGTPRDVREAEGIANGRVGAVWVVTGCLVRKDHALIGHFRRRVMAALKGDQSAGEKVDNPIGRLR